MTLSQWIIRGFASFFALPLWVIIWISLFLIPANFAGFFFLDHPVGWWIAVLGAGAIILNTGIIIINGGVSKVLAIPHLLFWAPLQIIIALEWPSLEQGTAIWWVATALLIINGISLFFDVYDTRQWLNGNRALSGFPEAKVRL